MHFTNYMASWGEKNKYVDRTSARKFKFDGMWVMDNDSKHTCKGVAKWLKDNKVKVNLLGWPLKRPQSDQSDSFFFCKYTRQNRSPIIYVDDEDGMDPA